jgi:hypothetical protein
MKRVTERLGLARSNIAALTNRTAGGSGRGYFRPRGFRLFGCGSLSSVKPFAVHKATVNRDRHVNA